MTLYYEGSDGSRIDLMGDGIYAQDPEKLTKNEWKYSTISGVNGIGRVKRFYKDTQECSLTLGIMADNADQFNEIMYKLHRTFDRDIRRLKPGKLWWNDWCKEVFAVETSQDNFEELFESVDKEVTFISVYPYWVRYITYQYGADNHAEAAGGLDYDHDFDFDYGLEEITEVVQNNCIDAANFELKFYGPIDNPSVTIGGHEYEVLTTLADGDYLTVNSLTKKILQYDAYGNVENVFHLRNRDSYIFQKIPEGETPILRSKDHMLDITIFDERGEPEWI